MLLSTAVSKLGDAVPVFNIPVLKTCPGKTKLCKKYCYAKRYHYALWSIKKVLALKLRESRKPEFVSRINLEIKSLHYELLSRGKALTRIRIHSSGDFYNQEYLNKWITIAIENPDLIFTAYTRSWMLDFSKIPDNMVLFYSVDKTTKNFPVQNLRRAYTAHKDDLILYKDMENTSMCNSKCFKCTKCYQKTSPNILFKVH